MAMTLKEADFGTVNAGSTLQIEVPQARGFFANGMLERDGVKVVSWESTELAGQIVTRKVSAAGEYILRVTLAFIGRDEVSVPVDFSILAPGGNVTTKTLTLSGLKGDIGRDKVFLDI